MCFLNRKTWKLNWGAVAQEVELNLNLVFIKAQIVGFYEYLFSTNILKLCLFLGRKNNMEALLSG